MAKDNPGFMARDVTRTVDPAAPNAQLLAQAAKIKGEATGAALKFAGDMGNTIYQSYQYNRAATEANDVMAQINAPEAVTPWRGEEAKAGMESIMSAPQVAKSDEEFDRIVGGAAQGVISKEQAQIRLAQKMRERIAANPGAAEVIRAAYARYSGNANWDTEMLQGVFRTKEDAANKLAEKQREKEMQADAEIASDIEVQGYFSQNFGLVGGQVLAAFNGPNGQQYKMLAADVRRAQAVQKNAERASTMTNLTDSQKGQAIGGAAITKALQFQNGVYGIMLKQAEALGANFEQITSDPKLFADFYSKNTGLISSAALQAKNQINQIYTNLITTPGYDKAHAADLVRRMDELDAMANSTNGNTVRLMADAFMKASKHGAEQGSLKLDMITKGQQLMGIKTDLWNTFLNIKGKMVSTNPADSSAGFKEMENFKRAQPTSVAAMEDLFGIYTSDPTNPAVGLFKSTIANIQAGRGPETIDANDPGQKAGVLAAKEHAFAELSAIGASTSPVTPKPSTINSISYALKHFNPADPKESQAIGSVVIGKNGPFDKFLGTLDDSTKNTVLNDIISKQGQRVLDPRGYAPKKVIDLLTTVNSGLVGDAKAVVFTNSNGMLEVGIQSQGTTVPYMKSGAITGKVAIQTNLEQVKKYVDNLNVSSAVFSSVKSRQDSTVSLDVVRKEIAQVLTNGVLSKGAAALMAPSKLFPTENSMKRGMGNPASETSNMFSENSDKELQEALSKYKPGTDQYNILKAELDSRSKVVPQPMPYNPDTPSPKVNLPLIMKSSPRKEGESDEQYFSRLFDEVGKKASAEKISLFKD